MPIREILTEPNKILRQKSLVVNEVNKDIQNLMDDMLLTMYAAPGIGLAAIQIGIPKRVIVIDLSRNDEEKNGKAIIQKGIENITKLTEEDEEMNANTK